MAEAAVQQFEQEQWLAVQEAFPEIQQRAEERTARYLGGLALANEVMIEPVENEVNNSTLMAAVHEAALGDEASRQVVWNNVSTDVVERVFKVASQSKVELQVDSNVLSQKGRVMVDIHGNTLQHTTLNGEMYGRTIAELTNTFVIEELLPAGILETHDVLVIEPCSQDEETRRDYKFFTDTDSMAMQLLSVNGQTAMLESAFVAGKPTPDSPRRDMQTLQTFVQRKGIDMLPTTVNGVVQFVMLLPKGNQPRHIEDVVEDYDDIDGTFYGQAKPRQDYKQYAQECYERNQSFNDIVDRITNQLIEDAPTFKKPIEANVRLDYLSERLTVRRARYDHRIDPRVFGAEAAYHTEQARILDAQGDTKGADQAMAQAQETADSGSCPLYKGANAEDGDSDEGKSELKWMKCPHCDAKVFADPCASVLKCWDCKAKVVNGVTFKGNGGSKKRRQERQAKLQKQAQAELAAV